MRSIFAAKEGGKAAESGGKKAEVAEDVVWRGKPVVIAFYDGLAGGALLITVSALLPLIPVPGIAWLSALGMACGALLMSFAFIRAKANTYVITKKGVRREYRFVVVRVDEAPFEKVTNTVVEQDVVGRIFGFGDVHFDTAGTPFQGVLFKGVKNLAAVKKIADESRKA